MLPDSGGGKLSENPGGVTPLVCVCQDVEEECRKERGCFEQAHAYELAGYGGRG